MRGMEENLECNMMTSLEIKSSTITKCISRKKTLSNSTKTITSHQYKVYNCRQNVWNKVKKQGISEKGKGKGKCLHPILRFSEVS